MKIACIALLAAVAASARTKGGSTVLASAEMAELGRIPLNKVSTRKYMVTSHFSFESVPAIIGEASDAENYFEAYSDGSEPVCWPTDDEKTKARQYCLATQLVTGYYLAAAMSQWYGPSDEYKVEHVSPVRREGKSYVPNPLMFAFDETVDAYKASSIMRDSRRELLARASSSLKTHICGSEEGLRGFGSRNVGTRSESRFGYLDAKQCAAIVDGSRAQLEARNVLNFERGCKATDGTVFEPYMCPLSTIGSSLIRCGRTASKSFHGCSPKCAVDASSHDDLGWDSFADHLGEALEWLQASPSVSLDEYSTAVSRYSERLEKLIGEAKALNEDIDEINKQKDRAAAKTSTATLIRPSLKPTGKRQRGGVICSLADPEFPGVASTESVLPPVHELAGMFAKDKLESGTRALEVQAKTSMTMKLSCTTTVSQKAKLSVDFSSISIKSGDMKKISGLGSVPTPPPHPEDHRSIIDAVYFPEVSTDVCSSLGMGPVTVSMTGTIGTSTINIVRETPGAAIHTIAKHVSGVITTFETGWAKYVEGMQSLARRISEQLERARPAYAALASAVKTASAAADEAAHSLNVAGEEMNDAVAEVAAHFTPDAEKVLTPGTTTEFTFPEGSDATNICRFPIRSNPLVGYSVCSVVPRSFLR